MARTEYGTTWWGEQWLNALTHIDYENRIPRGKTYANTGRVQSFKLDFDKHTVKARVTGNYDPFYTITLKLPEISKEQKLKLLDAIADSPLILAKLSARELDPDILPLCEKLGIKLFPTSWRDMKMNCTCPDSAVPCKHIAAVIYKVSQEIDANPFILFSLRGINLTQELANRGVEMERALTAELPTWEAILSRQDSNTIQIRKNFTKYFRPQEISPTSIWTMKEPGRCPTPCTILKSGFRNSPDSPTKTRLLSPMPNWRSWQKSPRAMSEATCARRYEKS